MNYFHEESQMSELKFFPLAAASLQRWYAMVATRDLSALPEILDAKAVFRSPMAHKRTEVGRSRSC
ncbi:hypothetical protein MAH4_30550 [Sessilibacter sp. MAH4]